MEGALSAPCGSGLEPYAASSIAYEELPDWLLTASRAKRLRRGDCLVREGEDGDYVYYLVSGLIRAVRREVSGGCFVVAEFGPGVMLGETEAMAGYRCYRATLLALEDCELRVLRTCSYLAWLKSSPDALFCRARTLLRQSVEQSRAARDLLFWSGSERLEYALWMYGRESPDGMVICETRQDLADRIKVSVKTVSRGLAALSDEGVVRLEGRRIVVDRRGVKELERRLRRRLGMSGHDERERMMLA